MYQPVQESVVRLYDVGRKRDDEDDEQVFFLDIKPYLYFTNNLPISFRTKTKTTMI